MKQVYTCNIDGRYISPYIVYTAPSIAPIGFASTAQTLNSITFHWTPLTVRQANGIVRWYIFTCNESSVVSLL